MTIRIRKVRVGDIRKLKEMYYSSSKELKAYFTPSLLTTRIRYFIFYISTLLQLNRVTAIVAVENRKIVGFAYITHFNKNSLGILVKEGYHRKGIGGKLLERILRGQRDVHLSVRTKNIKSVNLFRKYGFKITKKTLFMKRE